MSPIQEKVGMLDEPVDGNECEGGNGDGENTGVFSSGIERRVRGKRREWYDVKEEEGVGDADSG